ncbi:MAG TPA: BrnT family toxin [Bryobacteraceae bacterium]|jgi:hypothetical protein
MERFDWDDANTKHLAKHDVTPDEFEQAFRTAIRLRRNRMHRERRTLAVGGTEQARVLVLIYTRRGRNIRAVTAYTAPGKVRKDYAEAKPAK